MGFEVVAIVTPAKGKEDAVGDELKKLAETVKANEKGTLKYQMYKVTNGEGDGPAEFVVVEEYTDKAAFDHHVGTDTFKALGAKIQAEGLLAKGLDIKFVEKFAGYESK